MNAHAPKALRLAVAIAALNLCTTALAADPAAVARFDTRHGDGRVSAFYTWQEAIPAQPGKLLRHEPLEARVGLSSAGQQHRILFSSTDGVGGEAPITVSGALFLPKGQAPEGGWPIVAWGHGTLGIADICAPSWQGRSYRDVRYLNAWLDEGYAVVASDYQGIGVPGPNPQFNNRSNAYSILDSARAALDGFQGLSRKVLLVGQPQGGSAVVVAAGYAPGYAADLDVRGTIGTGIVYNPGRPVAAVKPADPQRDSKPDPSIAYGFYHVVAAQALGSAIEGEEVYSDLALPLLEQARTHCLASLAADVAGLGLTRANAFREPGKPAQYDAPADDVRRPFPTVKLSQPLFIGVGVDDHLAAVGLALAEDACAAGTTTRIHLYADRDHSGTVNASLEDSLPFAR
ncbi:lipase family protein [Phytopseudomonas dryadis]|uniref:Signal peptide-containing protein n=1 Tax=Phytopseudomonas dryadis TaxID=2487520 RepID=A0A4Q9R345_9GAMM|nr:lipase family protein [Pseudomonas dryadis]TBU94002.1 signal peptide-containing protein [Pseudomonas dryadis]